MTLKEFLGKYLSKDVAHQLADWLLTTVPPLLLIIVLFVLTLIVVKAIIRKVAKRIIRRLEEDEEDTVEREKQAATLIGLVRGAIVVTIWVLFILMFIKKLGIDITPILTGAGILGLAVGFGAQELVRDSISGFFIILENRIRTGDVVIINGTGGLVENINLRTITLRDLSGIVHTFQNGKIDTLANMTKEWSAMVFDIGVAYKENVDKVIEVIKQTGEELQKDPDFAKKIIEPIEIFGVDKFDDSAVIIKARLKTKPIEQWVTGREFNRRLKFAFDAKGIEIPFPHRTIYWGDEIAPLKLSRTEGE